jgi:hypothetical protein
VHIDLFFAGEGWHHAHEVIFFNVTISHHCILRQTLLRKITRFMLQARRLLGAGHGALIEVFLSLAWRI